MPLDMHDDPTQVFPEIHWKRYATERVCVPGRKSAQATNDSSAQGNFVAPNIPVAVSTRATRPTVPLMN